jgi:hypothetical protein
MTVGQPPEGSAVPVAWRDEVEKFCEICDWALQSGYMKKYLIDNNADLKVLEHGHLYPFFDRLDKILQEYWVLQVAKLHDPPRQSGRDNLSIAYITGHSSWDQSQRDELQKLQEMMTPFWNKIKQARHKILSHNDKLSHIENINLGGFDPGEDSEYFDILKEFANFVQMAVTGQPFVHDHLVENDVLFLMHRLKRGIQSTL